MLYPLRRPGLGLRWRYFHISAPEHLRCIFRQQIKQRAQAPCFKPGFFAKIQCVPLPRTSDLISGAFIYYYTHWRHLTDRFRLFVNGCLSGSLLAPDTSKRTYCGAVI